MKANKGSSIEYNLMKTKEGPTREYPQQRTTTREFTQQKMILDPRELVCVKLTQVQLIFL